MEISPLGFFYNLLRTGECPNCKRKLPEDFMLYHCPFCSVYIFVSYDAAKAFNEMPALQRAEFLNKAGGHQKQYEDPITHKIFEYPTQETRIYGITHWIPEEWKESK